MTAPPASTPPRRPNLFVVLMVGVFPLGFTGLGTTLLFVALPPLGESLMARSWPEVPGRVVQAQVVEVDQGGWGQGSKRTYTTLLEYEYQVAGKTYRADRTGLWPELRIQRLREETAARHPPGQPVRVFHDPADPARALLDRSVGAGHHGPGAGGLVMLALGFMMCVGYVRGVQRGE